MELAIDKLVVARGQRIVLDGITATVASGEALVLTGPNGAGKTTLLRTIAGFIRPLAGDIRLEGGNDELDLGQQCHHVGHHNGLKSALTVAENLAFWSSYLGEASPASAAHSIAAALDRLDLEPLAAIPVAYLSAGQKRRAGLARLLVAARPLWLLDEPTVSLDAASVDRVKSVVEDHLARGGLVVAATHLPLGLGNSRALALGHVQAEAA